MAISSTPWMGTVTLTTANSVYKLSDLLLALSDNVRPNLGSVPRAQFIAIQANPANATGAKYYIGNAGLSATHYGIQIYASQSWPIYSMDSNLIRMDDIYVMCDANNESMNITFLTQ